MEQLIYLWTNELFPPLHQRQHTIEEINEMLGRVWAVRFPDEKPPRASGPRTEVRAETNGLVIHLPVVARTLPIIYHEVAHVIELRAGRSGDHGEDFLRTVIDLYATYIGRDRDLMEMMARMMRLV